VVFAVGISAAQTISFEAASVKPSAPGARESIAGGPGTSNPGEVHYSGLSIQRMIMRAYGVTANQVSGPEWIASEKFDIVAKLPHGIMPQQIGPMLQNLMVERFGLKAHDESREVAGYELQIARSGLKMKESAGDMLPSAFPDAKEVTYVLQWDRTTRRATFVLSNGMWRLSGRVQSSAELTAFCETQIHLPVVDRTGLKGVYDYDIDVAPPPRPAGRGGNSPDAPAAEAQDPGPDFATALERQLGFHLEKKKVSIGVIVIDEIARTPTGN